MVVAPIWNHLDRNKVWIYPVDRGLTMSCLILTGGIWIVLCGFVTWNYYLVFTGQTSLEYSINKKLKKHAKINNTGFQNPYDFGFKENFRKFFITEQMGRYWFSWLLPIPREPDGDGMTFETVHPISKV
mmetsp:Transcript_9783/g.10854  ORF Transcript_9783/g.10854 Transcript_9783/m.10854 type:complete len:129 (+) Transcript_9783:176-562(+)